MAIPNLPVLQRIYASAPTDRMLILAMRIINEGQDDIRIVQAYKDHYFEIDGSLLRFEQGQISIQEPTINTRGQQNLAFGFVGVSKRALRHVLASLESKRPVYIEIFRFIEFPNGATEMGVRYRRIELTGGKINGDTCQFQASHHDLLNWRYPREIYTPQNAGGIRYA